MNTLRDWKFIIKLSVAIASFAVAVWGSRVDINSQSLHFRLLSQTTLQPDGKNLVRGLKVSVDGVELESPYLSVFELVNDGLKPIVTADFESPIELRLQSDGKVVQAEVTATSPMDLKAELLSEEQAVKLKPLLLNPKDTITIAIISSGNLPSFSPHARIAGVTSIPLEDATKTSNKYGFKWFFLSISFALFICLAIATVGSGRPIRLRAEFFIVIVTIVAGTLAFALFINPFIESLGVTSVWLSWAIFFLILFALAGAAFLAGRTLNRPINEEKPHAEETKHP